jgi:hypothetical protein
MQTTRLTPHVLVSTMGMAQNIGDVGHTPSMVRAFGRWAPQASITVWPLRAFGDAERAMLRRHCPQAEVVDGGLDEHGRPNTAALRRAFDDADVFVHGSGPTVHRAAHMAAWAQETGRPYGVFGVTVDPFGPSAGIRTAAGEPLPDGGPLDVLAAEIGKLPPDHLAVDRRHLLDGASFVYCRDTLSAGYVTGQAIGAPVVDFGPDATFAFDARDEPAAMTVLHDLGLAGKRFVCVIPRLRYSPRAGAVGAARTDEDRRRDAVNTATMDRDLDLLCDAVAGIVRETGMSVLVCPEMSYQVALAADHLAGRLPADVADRVAWLPRFWLPDEAASVYARAAALVSMECHSPIIATVAGTPALYVRQPTDTIKGHMWPDVGLGAHLREIDSTNADDLVDWVVSACGRDADEVTARVGAAARGAQAALATMVDTVLATAPGRPS